MDELYVTYVGDEHDDNHDSRILVMIIRITKAHSIWVFEVGTCRGHKPIIHQSCGAAFFSR